MADNTIYIQIDPQGTQTLVITDENEQFGTAVARPVKDNGKGVRKRVAHAKSVNWCVGPSGAQARIAFIGPTPLTVPTVTINPSASAWTCSGDYPIQNGANANRYKYTVTYVPSSGGSLMEDPQVIIDDQNAPQFLKTLLDNNGFPIAVVSLLVILGLTAYIFSLRRRFAAH